MSTPRVTILWLHQDLRLDDNPALAAAAQRGAVLPVYVHAPEEAGGWRPGAASNWWLHQSLSRLAAGYSERGVELQLRSGPSDQTLQTLIQASGADAIYFARRYEPALRARDQQLAEHFRAQGIQVEIFDGPLLHGPQQLRTQAGDPFRVFTPFWKRCREQLLSAAPQAEPAPEQLQGVALNENLQLSELQLLPSIAWDQGLRAAWTPGEPGAQQALADFLEAPVAHYSDGRDRPDQQYTSRLSPHLHFGEISPLRIWQQTRAAQLDERGTDKFLSEVGWREFAYHLLQNFPDTTSQPLNAKFEHFPWRDPDTDARAAADLQAWQLGNTGVDLVDAGMRELWATGWMHNRVRMVAASFLTKNLRIHWLHGARWFWDTLVDADLASNTLGWQWVAGCGADAAPYFRVFNPDLQAQKFDPQALYRRRWLADRAPPLQPIVDLKASRAAALSAYQQIKGG